MIKTNNHKLASQKDTFPLLPLRDIVVFPHMMAPLLVGRERSVNAVNDASGSDSFIILCTQKSLDIDEPTANDIYYVGTLAEILQTLKLPDGSIKVLIEGISKVRVKKVISEKEFFKVQIEHITSEVKKDVTLEALMRSVFDQFDKYIKLNSRLSQDIATSVMNISDPDKFANTIASYLTIKIEDKQKLLESSDTAKLLERLLDVLNRENEILQVEKRIVDNVKNKIDKSQKDFYLHEQLRAIEEELGQKDSYMQEVNDLKGNVRKAKMPKDIEAAALRELDKLSKMLPISPEATVTRNYIDWLLNLPWSVKTQDNLDIKNAEKILDDDHYGLEKPKERILEYLAVRKLSDSAKGQILCLVGPPGVGKTSLARSIARALNRNFVRISLGGVKDEAEIRGHRRTYIGALPGRIIQSIKKAKSRNPVFLLDEVDKMSADFRGDPSSALLEVLDPEENRHFSDHYLEVEFDLSEVMFITTCNVQYNIPLPLQDRMEMIKLPGYTEYEKLKIAELFLLPKQIKANGLGLQNINISDKAILDIIKLYTREAGVRELERQLAKICRKIAKDIVSNKSAKNFAVSRTNLHKYLGVPQYSQDKKEKKDQVGVVTALAWTETGGDIMPIETALVDGKGKLTLTGQLGKVMQESAQAALTYIRANAGKFKIKGEFYKNKDIHVHVPEGAIPKDGPSAGIAMASALVSSLTKRAIKSNVAMTGEITLRGRVLAVGGIKSKILAAHRASIDTVILPKENQKDLDEIPANIRKDMRFVLVRDMDEVLRNALAKS